MIIEAIVFETIPCGHLVTFFYPPGESQRYIRRSRDADESVGVAARNLIAGERVSLDSRGNTKDVATHAPPEDIQNEKNPKS